MNPERHEWADQTQLRKKLVRVARSLIGKPYKYGAKPEDAPDFFDCSSCMQYLYKQIGIKLPRSSISQAAYAKPKTTGYFKVGDLLFFRGRQGHYNDELFPNEKEPLYIGHVAMYIGNGKIIHANGKTKSVAETTWEEMPGFVVRTVRILL